ALAYPNFVETLLAIRPLYWTRLAGGTLYLAGMVVMAWNLWMTARSGHAVDGQAEVVVERPATPEVPWTRLVFGTPVVLSFLVIGLLAATAVMSDVASITMASIAVFVGVLGTLAFQLARDPDQPFWHRLLEGRALIFTGLTVAAVLVGGVAELIPSLVMQQTDPRVTHATPYTPIELEGRDIYVREGCYNCHSQMIRPMRFEALRYGDPSRAEESVYDHPFQW